MLGFVWDELHEPLEQIIGLAHQGRPESFLDVLDALLVGDGPAFITAAPAIHFEPQEVKGVKVPERLFWVGGRAKRLVHVDRYHSSNYKTETAVCQFLGWKLHGPRPQR